VRFARENPRWGYLGELCTRGIPVCKTSVATVLGRHGLPRAPRRLGPSWSAFLSAQATGVFATGFCGVDSVTLGATTSCSSSRWTAASFTSRSGDQPGYGLGHLSDAELHLRSRRRRTTVPLSRSRLGYDVRGVLRRGVQGHRHFRHLHSGSITQSERVGRTLGENGVRRLSRPPLIYSRRHLEHVLSDYVRHYNEACPHRGRQLSTPLPRHDQTHTAEISRRRPWRYHRGV